MATSKIHRVLCSGTVQLEKKNDFYKVITPYVVELSSCGAIPRCNPTTLNSRNLRRLIESFEEDVAPDIDNELCRKCRLQLAVLEKLYIAVERLELQGVRMASTFLSELIDGGHEDTNEGVRLELVSNEALIQLHLNLNRETETGSNDGPAAVLDDSIVRGKLNKLADILEKHLRHSVTFSRIMIAVPSAALSEEVNKILLAMPRIASSFIYDVRRYSKATHKNFLDSQYNCIVVVSDPSTNEAPVIEISGIDLAICLDVPKTALRKVPKWKGSIYMLLTSVENQSFHEKTLLVDEPNTKAPKTGSYSMNLKTSLAKQAARGRKGHLSKEEQVLFDRNFRCGIDVLPPERGVSSQPTASQRRSVRHLSLSEWGPWQKELQQTFRIGHAEDTEAMVETLRICDRLNGGNQIDDFEKNINANFCPEDVLTSRKGKVPQTSNNDENYVMNIDDEEFDCKGYDFLAITTPISRYILDSGEKINDFLIEIGIATSTSQCELYTDGIATQISAAATSTSPISLAGTDGPPQSSGNPSSSPAKPDSFKTTSQKIPEDYTIGNGRPSAIRSQQESNLENEDLFNDIVTPLSGRGFPATSTPFAGIEPGQGMPDSNTPLRPNPSRTPMRSLQQAQSMELTAGQSRLGVTALVNLVQKRKKQKNLQHFFKAQSQPEDRHENVSEIVVILSDDESVHANNNNDKNDSNPGNEEVACDRTVMSPTDIPIAMGNVANMASIGRSSNGHSDSDGELLFDFDDPPKKTIVHSPKISRNVNPEQEFDPIVQLSATPDMPHPGDVVVSAKSSTKQELTQDSCVNMKQVDQPKIDDNEDDGAHIFDEINEYEVVKNLGAESKDDPTSTAGTEINTWMSCHVPSDRKNDVGKTTATGALIKGAHNSAAVASSGTEIRSSAVDTNFCSTPATVLDDDDDLFDQIDEQAIIKATQKINSQTVVQNSDAIAGTRQRAASNPTVKMPTATKKFRSVFDALEEHEQPAEMRNSVRSIFDIMHKFATRDKQPAPQVECEPKPAEYGDIFTDEFKEELRIVDELKKQRMQDTKQDEDSENDSDELFNSVIEPDPAKIEIEKDDVLQRLLKKVDGRRWNENHEPSPPSGALKDDLKTVNRASAKMGFIRDNEAPIQDKDNGRSPMKCLPITVTSTALRRISPPKKEIIDTSSDDDAVKPHEEKLKPKKLSLVEKLKLNYKEPTQSKNQSKPVDTSTATVSGVQSQMIEKRPSASGDPEGKTMMFRISSSSEDEVPIITRRNFRKQKSCKRDWSGSSSNDEEKPVRVDEVVDGCKNTVKVASVKSIVPKIQLEDRTMSDVFEGREERRPKKRPRCEFVEEEATLDSVDEDAVSSDEEETSQNAYEMNSFVDDASPTPQTQGMYLQVNAQLSPREDRRPVRGPRNLVPMEECYSQSPSDDDTSYDSQDSFVVKGDIEEATLPLEITVMHRTSTPSTDKPNRKRSRKRPTNRTETSRKRRRVFLQSTSDEHEATTSVRSERSFSKHSSIKANKDQNPGNDDNVTGANGTTGSRNNAAPRTMLNDPVVPVDVTKVVRPDVAADGLPTKVVLASMTLMEMLPDILVGLNRTFDGYHIEPVDMSSFEDHQADIYVEDLCVKILPFNALASDQLQRKTRHQLSRFRQMAAQPILVIYTGLDSTETSALALPTLVHLFETNVRIFYANNQVDVLMLLKCLTQSTSMDTSNLLRFLDSPELHQLLEVPDLNIATASTLLASKKYARNVFQCSAEDITRLCVVSDEFAKQIFYAFQQRTR